MERYLGAVILILISVLVSMFYPNQGNNVFQNLIDLEIPLESGSPTNDTSLVVPVRWQTLQKLDYKNNKITDDTLKQVLNRTVRVPGFAVPLTDNLQSVSEFLLVPNQMACIHVPAPPPNLIVYVRLEKPAKIEDLIGPLWVQGVLRLKTLRSVYGSSSFHMEQNVKVEPYEF